MKSIIKTKFEKMLLAVNVSDEKTAKLMDIMRAYGGEVKAVGADCGGQQLGYLLGFTGFKESDMHGAQSALDCIAACAGA